MFRCLSSVANFSTFNKTHKKTNFTKIFFSRHNLKEIMNYREGIIFKISSPHTEKIYIGCSSLPLKRAVSGLRASAKFRKLSCNILFQAGDIKSEVLAKFRDITVLEMRKKLGIIQAQHLDKSSIQTGQGERMRTDTEKRRCSSKCTGKTKTRATGDTL